MNLINYCNRIIEYSFYTIFFLVPLVFASNTSELFEFHKMWLTFGMTTVIMTAWITKMIVQKKLTIQRTPLDIILLLFLLSQFISTIFSLDQHISWWGYYSRFNGGLLSTICYFLLYYAFVSNMHVKQTIRVLSVSLISGLLVALWGFPSHFGSDPTCFVFRGTLDTSCWTEAFKPTIRIFSTLGQPAWLAAYLSVLLPLTMAFALKKTHSQMWFWSLIALSGLFYVCLIFANTRAGYLSFLAADILFWAIIFVKNIFPQQQFIRYFAIFNGLFLLCTIIFGSPIGGYHGLAQAVSPAFAQTAEQPATGQAQQEQTPPAPSDTNITDSGDIRLLVWRGAIDAWKANPILGTGVETFAFAYYKHRPVEHNMTSEWDYLYNKAHNEYLNYLTTTGLFGLGTYLFFIGLFIFLTAKWLLITKVETHNDVSLQKYLMVLGLFSGWVSILISNFFGFSVVIINLYFFLIPVFVFLLANIHNKHKTLEFSFGESEAHRVSLYQWIAIVITTIIGLTIIWQLLRYWQADISYALGNNYDKVGMYQEAYPHLLNAFEAMKNEPVYADEFSINLGTLATALYMQKDATNGAQFAQQAITLNDKLVKEHPHNLVYWKNRVRLFYTLAQGDPENQQKYLMEALQAIQKAHELAPTDAKIAYNLGVLYGQTGDYKKAIEILEETVKLKPDYRDAYFALGLSYRALAVDENDKVVNPAYQQKAVEAYQYILKNIAPEDKPVKENLTIWGVE